METAEGGGLGLIGMQERATIVGGALEIESEPGMGTLIRMEIPLGGESGVTFDGGYRG